MVRPFEQQTPVLLMFRQMSAPVTVSVPGSVLLYLNAHFERSFAADGTLIFRQPAEVAAPLLAPAPVSM